MDKMKVVAASAAVLLSYGALVYEASAETADSQPAQYSVIDVGSQNGSFNATSGNYVLDFGNSNQLSLSSGFTVGSGASVYVASSNSGNTTANISAANINVASGGLLSSVLPAFLFNSYTTVTSMNLTASQSIVNAGTIASAGSLSMTAPQIVNAVSAGGQLPIMQAVTNLNLNTANLVNSGILQSNIINVATSLETLNAINQLLISNNGGSFIASQIDIGNSAFAGKFGLDGSQLSSIIRGGDYLCDELNILVGNSRLSTTADKISGVLNVHAGELALSVADGNLTGGVLQVTGDPTITTAGTYTITGSMSFTDSLTIIAGQDIVTQAGLTNAVLSTANPGGASGNINLIAGAQWNLVGGDPEIVRITGNSATGGSVVIPGVSKIQASPDLSSPVTSDGGSITIAAFAGNNPTSGRVIMDPGSVVETHVGALGPATVGGDNGYISIVAGAAMGATDSIVLGTIDNRYSPGNASYNPTNNALRSITVGTAQPKFYTYTISGWFEDTSITLDHGGSGYNYIGFLPLFGSFSNAVNSSISVGSIYNDMHPITSDAPGITIGVGNTLHLSAGSLIQSFGDLRITNGDSARNLILEIPDGSSARIASLWQGSLYYQFGTWHISDVVAHGVMVNTAPGTGLQITSTSGGGGLLEFGGTAVLGGAILQINDPFFGKHFATTAQQLQTVDIGTDMCVMGGYGLRMYTDNLDMADGAILTSKGSLEVLSAGAPTTLNTPSDRPVIFVAGGLINLSGIGTIDLSTRTGDARQLLVLSGFNPDYNVGTKVLTLTGGAANPLSAAGVSLQGTNVIITGTAAEAGGTVILAADKSVNPDTVDVNTADYLIGNYFSLPGYPSLPATASITLYPYIAAEDTTFGAIGNGTTVSDVRSGNVVPPAGGVGAGAVNLSSTSTNGGNVYLVSSGGVTYYDTVNVSSVSGNGGGVFGIGGTHFTVENPTPFNGESTALTLGAIQGGGDVEVRAGANASSVDGLGGSIVMFANGGIGTSFSNATPTLGNLTVRGVLDVSSVNSVPGTLQLYSSGGLAAYDATLNVSTQSTSPGTNASPVNLAGFVAREEGLPSAVTFDNSIAPDTTLTATLDESLLTVQGFGGSSGVNFNNVTITATSVSGDGGDVRITTRDGNSGSLNQFAIDTSTTSGNAGSITIVVGARIQAGSNAQLTAKSVDGNAGNVTVIAQEVNLSGGTIDVSAVNGNGGQVVLAAVGYGDGGPVGVPNINTSSQAGNGGNISLAGSEIFDGYNTTTINTSTASTAPDSKAGNVYIAGGASVIFDDALFQSDLPLLFQSGISFGLSLPSTTISMTSNAGTSGNLFALAHYVPGFGGGDGGPPFSQQGGANDQYAALFGTIDTSSQSGTATDVLIASTRGVQVTGDIKTGGQLASGNVVILGGSNWGNAQLSASGQPSADLYGASDPPYAFFPNSYGDINVNTIHTGSNDTGTKSGDISLVSRHGSVSLVLLDTSSRADGADPLDSPGKVLVIGEYGVYAENSTIDTSRLNLPGGDVNIVAGYQFDAIGTLSNSLTVNNFSRSSSTDYFQQAGTDAQVLQRYSTITTFNPDSTAQTGANVTIVSADSAYLGGANSAQPFVNTSTNQLNGTAGNVTLIARKLEVGVDVPSAIVANAPDGTAGNISLNALAADGSGVSFTSAGRTGDFILDTSSAGNDVDGSGTYGNLSHYTTDAQTSATGQSNGTVSYQSFRDTYFTGTASAQGDARYTSVIGSLTLENANVSAGNDIFLQPGPVGNINVTGTLNAGHDLVGRATDGSTSITGSAPNIGHNIDVTSGAGSIYLYLTPANVANAVSVVSNSGLITFEGDYTVGVQVDINSIGNDVALGAGNPLTAIVGSPAAGFSPDPLIVPYTYTDSAGNTRTLWNYQNIQTQGTTTISGQSVTGSGAITTYGDITVTSTRNAAPTDGIHLADSPTNPLLLLSYGGWLTLQAARTVEITGGTLVSRYVAGANRGGGIGLYAGPIAANPWNANRQTYFLAPALGTYTTNPSPSPFDLLAGSLTAYNDYGSDVPASGGLLTQLCAGCTFAGKVNNSTLYSYGGILSLNDQTGTSIDLNAVNLRPLFLQGAPSVPPVPPVVPPTGDPPTVTVTITPPGTTTTVTVTIPVDSKQSNGLIPTDKINEQAPVPLIPGQRCSVLDMSSASAKKSKDSEDDSVWFMASGDCQICVVDLDDPAIVMKGGTGLSSKGERHFQINNGKIAVLATKHAVEFDTKYGTVTIPPEGAAIISQSESGVVRVANLNGQATFKPVGMASEAIKSEPGEEMVLAENDASDEELIPVDGMDRTDIVSGSLKIIDGPEPRSIKKKTSKFDRRSLLNNEPMIACTGCLSLPLKKKVAMLKNAIANGSAPLPLVKWNPPGKQQTGSLPKGKFSPVAYTAPSAGSAASLNRVVTEDLEVRKLSLDQIKVNGPGKVQLTSGSGIVSAKRDIEIDCGQVKVYARAGAVLQIHHDDKTGVLRVRNLTDTCKNSVQAVVRHRNVDLAPGQEAVFGRSIGEVSKSFGSDALARRVIKQKSVSSQLTCGTAEFSPITLILQDPILKALCSSKHSDDRVLIGRLLKMAACLAQVTRTHGPYSRSSF